MTTPTCATCRWWGAGDPDDLNGYEYEGMVRNAGEELDYYDPTPAEASRVAEIEARVKRCGSPKLLFYVLPQHGQAAVVDGSEYRGALMTDAAFGCTNHEPKDAPTPR